MMLAAALSPFLALVACLLVFRLARARAGGMRAVAAAVVVWWLAAIGGTLGAMFVLLLLWPSGRSLALAGCLATEAAITAAAVLLAMRIYGRPRADAQPGEANGTSPPDAGMSR